MKYAINIHIINDVSLSEFNYNGIVIFFAKLTLTKPSLYKIEKYVINYCQLQKNEKKHELNCG